VDQGFKYRYRVQNWFPLVSLKIVKISKISQNQSKFKFQTYE
jgi:hypothetical protein